MLVTALVTVPTVFAPTPVLVPTTLTPAPPLAASVLVASHAIAVLVTCACDIALVGRRDRGEAQRAHERDARDECRRDPTTCGEGEAMRIHDPILGTASGWRSTSKGYCMRSAALESAGIYGS